MSDTTTTPPPAVVDAAVTGLTDKERAVLRADAESCLADHVMLEIDPADAVALLDQLAAAETAADKWQGKSAELLNEVLDRDERLAAAQEEAVNLGVDLQIARHETEHMEHERDFAERQRDAALQEADHRQQQVVMQSSTINRYATALAAAQAEAAQHERDGWTALECYQRTLARAEKAEAERDAATARAAGAERLREALKRFGVHRNDCRAFPATSEAQILRACTCGLVAALATTTAPDAGASVGGA